MKMRRRVDKKVAAEKNVWMLMPALWEMILSVLVIG